MNDFRSLSAEIGEQDTTFLAGIPYVYHCHHFNLFHDQTIDDALGESEGFRLKARAAQVAAHELLSAVFSATGASTPAERLELAHSLFAWMGQGKLGISADGTGGDARGEYLHYSYSWREKYGSKVKRVDPIDAFAAGWSAAATEAAFGLPCGSLTAEELDCLAKRDPACTFDLTPSEAGEPAASVDRTIFEQHAASPAISLDEVRISTIARGLRDFVIGIDGDQRGLVNGFGVYITRHLSSYYDQSAYDTIHRIEEQSPASVGVIEELFGESGHVCVFYTFGNILLSPEWEGMVGTPSGDIEETVSSCTAMARGLGFGHWSIAALEPQKRLVLQASSNYEAPFYLRRYGRSNKPRCYFFANAARAIMQLAHRVDWRSKPVLDEALYQSLFRGGASWDIEMTQCQTRGDEINEVVVTRREA